MASKYCNLENRCPVLNKSECPIRQLWARTEKLDKAKRELVILFTEQVATGRYN